MSISVISIFLHPHLTSVFARMLPTAPMPIIRIFLSVIEVENEPRPKK